MQEAQQIQLGQARYRLAGCRFPEQQTEFLAQAGVGESMAKIQAHGAFEEP